MKVFGICVALLMLTCSAAGAAGPLGAGSPLYQSVAALDRQLFESGFNGCNLDALDELVADDLEFFHDEGGITQGKAAFVESIRNNICNAGYHATRELSPGTMEVFPLKNNGKIYGVLQRGQHAFFAQEGDKPIRKTATAYFSHVWLMEGDGWKLARVLSYGHLPAGEQE